MRSENAIDSAAADLRWAVLAICLTAAAMACSSPPKEKVRESQSRVHQVLAPYRGKNDLSAFVGDPPAICLKSSPTTWLCQWRAGRRQPGWDSLAAAIRTNDYINLLCELPLDGSARAADSCTAHPRRSNRFSWEYPKKKGKGARIKPEEIARMREQNRKIADQAIANATTLVELSRLMGTTPDWCSPRAEEQQLCLWRTTNQTFGHGTLAMWIGESKRKKILFQCALPTNGTKRAPGSCTADVGA
jgi:hypothetical protein